MNKQKTTDRSFTISKEVKEAIESKINELLELCQMHQIPMFTSVCTGNDATGSHYMNKVYSGKANNIPLTDDKIERHILIANGFAAVPMRESVDLDMDYFG